MSGWTRGHVAAVVLAATSVILLTGQMANAEAAAPENPHRVEIQATSAGFVPDTVRLVAGADADLVFTRTAGAACVAQVHIPDLGVGLTALPEATPVAIRVRPQEPGTYEFRCAMNMRRGVIVVTRQTGGRQQ